MSRAPLFGEITLTCGPSWPGPDGGLAFTSGRMNVFIGPNNAGKSLMLRELSGVEPRGYSNHRSEWLPGKLVFRVDYGRETEDQLADEVKERCLNRGDEVHDALRRLPWRELIRTLREREEAARALVDWLAEELVRSPLAAQVPPGLVNLLNSERSQRDMTFVTIILALLGEGKDPVVTAIPGLCAFAPSIHLN